MRKFFFYCISTRKQNTPKRGPLFSRNPIFHHQKFFLQKKFCGLFLTQKKFFSNFFFRKKKIFESKTTVNPLRKKKPHGAKKKNHGANIPKRKKKYPKKGATFFQKPYFSRTVNPLRKKKPMGQTDLTIKKTFAWLFLKYYETVNNFKNAV